MRRRRELKNCSSMKRFILTISALFVALTAAAQVTREVEVVKEYIPKLPPARKLDMATDKQDTVNIRPEIDYTITPNSFASALTTSKVRPATITYWDFDKRYPFYLKAGVGYPLATELDVYASTNRADVGYLSGYVNHRGRFSNIKDSYTLGGQSFSYNNDSRYMDNRIGFNGGKYIGRYTFDGDIYYQSNLFHRYAQPIAEEQTTPEVNYENFAATLKFGDSFSDMSKVNFSVYATADYYNDKSNQLVDDRKLQQFSTAVGATVGREIATRTQLMLTLKYNGYYGFKSLDSYSDNIISATAMVNFHTKKKLDVRAGLTYSYDHLKSVEKSHKHHVFPHLYLGANLFDNGSFVPYIEVNGELKNNSYQQLQSINPYVIYAAESIAGTPNTYSYNFRIGFAGNVLKNRLSYRLYGDAAIVRNALYWYAPQPAYFAAEVGNHTVWSINAAVEYKPLSVLYFSLKAKAMAYSQSKDLYLANHRPSFEGEFNARYTHRKFAVGASAHLVGKTNWSVLQTPDAEQIADRFTTVSYPAYVDLSLVFDWFVGKRCTLYVEGRNLANAKIYHWALYKEYGIGALAGVKVQF